LAGVARIGAARIARATRVEVREAIAIVVDAVVTAQDAVLVVIGRAAATRIAIAIGAVVGAAVGVVVAAVVADRRTALAHVVRVGAARIGGLDEPVAIVVGAVAARGHDESRVVAARAAGTASVSEVDLSIGIVVATVVALRTARSRRALLVVVGRCRAAW